MADDMKVGGIFYEISADDSKLQEALQGIKPAVEDAEKALQSLEEARNDPAHQKRVADSWKAFSKQYATPWGPSGGAKDMPDFEMTHQDAVAAQVALHLATIAEYEAVVTEELEKQEALEKHKVMLHETRLKLSEKYRKEMETPVWAEAADKGDYRARASLESARKKEADEDRRKMDEARKLLAPDQPQSLLSRIFSGVGDLPGMLGKIGGIGGKAAAGVEGLMGGAGGGVAGLIGGEGAGALLGGPVGLIAAAAVSAAKELWALGKAAVAAAFNLARLANPAYAERMDRAMLDAQAVVGQRFVPLMNVVTQVVRAFGDFLATVLPSTQAMRTAFDALRPAVDAIRRVFAVIAEALHPVFEALAEAGGGLMAAFSAVAGVIADLYTALRPLYIIVGVQLAAALKVVAFQLQALALVVKLTTLPLQILGKLMAAPKLKDSTGAAPSEYRYIGVEDIGKQAALAALRSAGGQKSPEEQSVGYLQKISGQIDDLVANLADWLQKPSQAKEDAKAAASLGARAALDGGSAGHMAGSALRQWMGWNG